MLALTVVASPARLNASAMRVDALRHAAVELADDRLLALDSGDHMAGREQHAALVGLAGEHVLAADHLGEDLLVAEAVLQRHDRRCRGPTIAPRALDRLARVERLDQHDDEVDRRRCRRRRRRPDLDRAVDAAFAQREAVAVHRIDVLAPRVDQRHVGAALRQRAADGAAQRAGSPESRSSRPHPSAPLRAYRAQGTRFASRRSCRPPTGRESRAGKNRGSQYRRARCGPHAGWTIAPRFAPASCAI